MLSNLRFRTKLAVLVAVPLIAALAVAVPGIRSRRQDLHAIEQSQALLAPATAVRGAAQRILDEGSLSAWWVGTNDPAVKARLEQARHATDAAVRDLRIAERDAAATGASDAAAGIHDLREAAALMSQQREFVDLRITTDPSLVAYRDLADRANAALDTFARAPQRPLAALLFRDLATLGHLDAALADERSILVLAFGRNALSNSLASDLSAASTRQNIARDTLDRQGHPATRAEIDRTTATLRSAGDEVRRRRATALTQRLLPTTFGPAAWFDAATVQINGWREVEQRIAQRTKAILDTKHDESQSALVWVAVGSAGVLLLALLVALLVARATMRPLRRLADRANDVATHQLPALVETLRDPDAPMPTMTPIAVNSRDELGELARAFNRVERTTVEVAELQREALRTGISDLYVNLARRNQPLLEHQLAVIESLEADERDPERLDAYFTLDHLATRIRRNADSLLVLAGVGHDDGVRAPIQLLDVVRGAVSETSEFRRVDLAGIPTTVAVAGHAAGDLAHLLSELLENATTYSPPGTRVTVTARPTEPGLEITISDQGIGIPPDRVSALNAMLEKPPAPGLVLSRSLGLVVVGRLARRIGVTVSIRSARDVGTGAIVIVPGALLEDREPAVDLVAAEQSASAPSELVAAPVTSAPTTPPSTAPSTRPDAALAAVPAALEDPANPAAPSSLDLSTAERTDGLPRRTPQEPAPAAADQVATPPRRSPDAVFELVARYETGRRRARDPEAVEDGDTTPEEQPQ